MTSYPVVFETEDSGAVSAYVPGLPVYAAADSREVAEQAIQDALADYLSFAPLPAVAADVRIARVTSDHRVRIVGLGAALGAKRSSRKAKASRLNGLLGGRPRVVKATPAGRLKAASRRSSPGRRRRR